MNKKTIERIAVLALAAFLIGYFVYQVNINLVENAKGGIDGTIDGHRQL
ncbi:MAG: hypothetical protein WAM14_09140 [Candidatus Nitrosopolaris sp.]